VRGKIVYQGQLNAIEADDFLNLENVSLSLLGMKTFELLQFVCVLLLFLLETWLLERRSAACLPVFEQAVATQLV
jgi:hypothetical protein